MEGHGYYDVFCIDVYDVFNKKNRIISDLEHSVHDYALDQKSSVLYI